MTSYWWVAAVVTWVVLAALGNVWLDRIQHSNPFLYWVLHAGRWAAGLAGGFYAFCADFKLVPFELISFAAVMIGSVGVTMLAQVVMVKCQSTKG